MAIPTTETFSPPSTTLTQVTIPSSTTTTTTHQITTSTTTIPTPLTTSTQVPRTFPTTNITSTTSTSNRPVTTTTSAPTPPASIATSTQVPTTSATMNTTMTTSSNPITATITSRMTTTTTSTQRTTTTTESSITCTSVNSDIIDCLTQYSLPSYNLTDYVNNAVTICEKLECIMDCIKTAVGDCYKNNILYLTYDTVALITTYRYMCDNFNETLRAFKECVMQTKASNCHTSLLTAIFQAENNYVTNKNKTNYLFTMCSGFSAYKTCVSISASSNCTPTFATRINTVQRSWYSYYQCGVTSELYATYYQDPVCTQDDADGTIFGHSLIHIRLLLGSLCLLYFFKY